MISATVTMCDNIKSSDGASISISVSIESIEATSSGSKRTVKVDLREGNILQSMSTLKDGF